MLLINNRNNPNKNDIFKQISKNFNAISAYMNIITDKPKPFIVILDIDAKDKHKYSYVTKDTYITELVSKLNNNFYYTTVYKNDKSEIYFDTINKEEIMYNAVINCVKELNYIINNILNDVHKFLIITLGNYKEYKLIKEILTAHYNENNKVIITTAVRHYNQLINNYNFAIKPEFLKDIKKVNKKITMLNNI